MEMKGIDVSRWNGTIDWKKVKSCGIQFAMVRIGFGASNGGLTVDPKFATNVNGAFENGIKVGVYLYAYAKTVDAAKTEADEVLKTIKTYADKISFPIAYDMEDSSLTKLKPAVLTSIANTFCNVVKDAGFFPVVYSNPNWLTNYLNQKDLKHEIWLAHYASKPKFQSPIWQYTDSGTVKGISGNVDLDIAYKDYSYREPEKEQEIKLDTTEDVLKEAEKAARKLGNVGFINSPEMWADVINGKKAPSPVDIGWLLIKIAKKF